MATCKLKISNKEILPFMPDYLYSDTGYEFVKTKLREGFYYIGDKSQSKGISEKAKFFTKLLKSVHIKQKKIC